MKILPEKEFKELAVTQKMPEGVAGFIDMETHEVVVPEGARTRIRTHEIGHKILEHHPKTVKFYGKGKKDVYKMRQPWRQLVDDEIEAEIYSYKMMGKRVGPRVGMVALRELLIAGWKDYPALSLVIGRLRHYGIKVLHEDRMDLISIMGRDQGMELEEEEEWVLDPLN